MALDIETTIDFPEIIQQAPMYPDRKADVKDWKVLKVCSEGLAVDSEGKEYDLTSLDKISELALGKVCVFSEEQNNFNKIIKYLGEDAILEIAKNRKIKKNGLTVSVQDNVGREFSFRQGNRFGWIRNIPDIFEDNIDIQTMKFQYEEILTGLRNNGFAINSLSSAPKMAQSFFHSNLRGFIPSMDELDRKHWERASYATKGGRMESCFPAGTNILLRKEVSRNGSNQFAKTPGRIIKSLGTYTEHIDDVKVGDEVLSYNVVTGKKEFKKVLQTIQTRGDCLVSIDFSNGNRLECTKNHPIAVVDEGKIKWILAKDVVYGMECIQKKYTGLAIRLVNLDKSGYYKKLHSDTMKEIWSDEGSKYNSLDYTKLRKDIFAPYKEKAKEGTRKYREEHREELSASLSAASIKKWEDPDYIGHTAEHKRKLSKAIRRARQREKETDMEGFVSRCVSNFGGHGKHPNNFENAVIQVLDSNFPNQWNFVGDFSCPIVCNKRVRFPDFKHCHYNKIIEVFGEKHKVKDYGSVANYKRITSRFYHKAGYEVMYISYDDFRHKHIETINRVKQFMFNPGTEIVKAVEVKIKTVNVDVYNLEVEDNNNYFAEGILVHNCKIGEFKNVYDYDMVSAYGSLLKDLPCISPYYMKWFSSKQYHPEADMAFCLCEINMPLLSDGFAPFRMDVGNVFFPYGKFGTWLAKPEIDALLSLGIEIKIREGSFGKIIKDFRPFEKITDDLWKLRNYPSCYRVAKGMLSKGWGKFLSEYGGGKVSSLWNPIYAAHITSMARARLLELTRLVGDSLVVFSIDGFSSKKPLPENLLSDELGGMKLHYTGNMISYTDFFRDIGQKKSWEITDDGVYFEGSGYVSIFGMKVFRYEDICKPIQVSRCIPFGSTKRGGQDLKLKDILNNEIKLSPPSVREVKDLYEKTLERDLLASNPFLLNL